MKKQKIIARFSSEIFLKGQAARQSLMALTKNSVAHQLQQQKLSHELSILHDRLLIEVDGLQQALPLLQKVFGISYLIPVLGTCGRSLDEIEQVGQELFQELIRGKSFAVRCRKAGAQEFSKQELCRRLGAKLNPFGRVQLTSPEVEVCVDVHNEKTYFYTQSIQAAGGLPINGGARALVLFSGGIDSTVAAWKTLKRGVAIDFLYCNISGAASERQALQVAKVFSMLWCKSYKPQFYSLNFKPLVTDMANSSQGLQQVLLKRRMLEAAEILCRQNEYDAIVTGESIGQVSSQTLKNLKVINEKINATTLRPLIGEDKPEIINKCRQIGLLSLCEKVKENCQLTKNKPTVAARLGRIQFAESNYKLPISEFIKENLNTINLSEIGAKELRINYLFVDSFDDKAVVVDCQPQHMRRHWHIPNSTHIDALELQSGFSKLPKTKKYILYCTYGTQTPYLAELMQQNGYEAYAFRGGVEKVKQHFSNT